MVFSETWETMLPKNQNLRYADVALIRKHNKIPSDINNHTTTRISNLILMGIFLAFFPSISNILVYRFLISRLNVKRPALNYQIINEFKIRAN